MHIIWESIIADLQVSFTFSSDYRNRMRPNKYLPSSEIESERFDANLEFIGFVRVGKSNATHTLSLQ
jgi:hypothetical protein